MYKIVWHSNFPLLRNYHTLSFPFLLSTSVSCQSGCCNCVWWWRFVLYLGHEWKHDKWFLSGGNLDKKESAENMKQENGRTQRQKSVWIKYQDFSAINGLFCSPLCSLINSLSIYFKFNSKEFWSDVWIFVSNLLKMTAHFSR